MVHACGCEARSSSPFILTLSFCPVILFASCWWMYVSGCQCLDSLCPFYASFVPGSLCCLLPCRPCRLIQCFPSYQAHSLFLLLVLAFGVHNAKDGPQPRQNTCREPCTSSPTSTWKACRALQRCLNSRVCIPRPHSGCFSFVCRTQITLSLLPVRQPTSCRWGKRDKAVWTPWDQVLWAPNDWEAQHVERREGPAHSTQPRTRCCSWGPRKVHAPQGRDNATFLQHVHEGIGQR